MSYFDLNTQTNRLDYRDYERLAYAALEDPTPDWCASGINFAEHAKMLGADAYHMDRLIERLKARIERECK